MPQETGLPLSNIKEYIIKSRQEGYSDSVIIDNLKRSNWPGDVIESAMLSAGETIPGVRAKEPNKDATENSTVKESAVSNNPKFSNQEAKPKPLLPEKNTNSTKEKQPGISFWAVLSFFFSPIPIVGLLITMTAFDDMSKNKKSGMILALLALIVNFIVIGLIVYIAYQIFTLRPEQMTGAAKYLNDRFKFV